MPLSSALIADFVKSTVDKPIKNDETTAYGTVKIVENVEYVMIDGSELMTPASTMVAIADGDRVKVSIKNHSAMIIGNVKDPSASGSTVKGLSTIVAQKVDTEELSAERARIDTLVAANVTINNALTAQSARIDEIEAGSISTEFLEANYATIENLETAKGRIGNLETTYADVNGRLTAATANITTLSARQASFETATTNNFTAVNASITNLSGDYATFKSVTATNIQGINADISDIKANYAEVDFANIGTAAINKIFSDYGMIKDLVIVDGNITGELNADLIHASTITADKLVIKGEDGLYYQLNTDGESVTSEQTEYNSLNGGVITAKTVTADKVYVTDLCGFEATIGGFEIEKHSLHSIAKDSLSSVVPGTFMDDSGQFNFGDVDDFVKYYKVTQKRINKIGGHSEVIEGEIISAEVDKVVSRNSDDEVIYTYTIPDAVKALDGYGWSAGDVYNEVDFERKKFVKRVARVDLGTLSWSRNATYNIYYSHVVGKKAGRNYNLVCSSFTANPVYYEYLNNLEMAGTLSTDEINIKNDNYSSASDFKTAMNGVMLYYELATPIETDISEYLTRRNAIDFEAGGSISFEDEDGNSLVVPNQLTQFTGYKLSISATSFHLSTSKKDVESAILENKSIINDQATELNELSDSLDNDIESLKQTIDDTNTTLTKYSDAVDDVRGAINDAQNTIDAFSGFIDIDTEQATIELGDKSTPFGVRITNTEIDFKIDRTDGSTDIPASIGIDTEDSKSRLYVERATFEEEIAFGNFVWVKHGVIGEDGNTKINIGLVRKGGN